MLVADVACAEEVVMAVILLSVWEWSWSWWGVVGVERSSGCGVSLDWEEETGGEDGMGGDEDWHVGLTPTSTHYHRHFLLGVLVDGSLCVGGERESGGVAVVRCMGGLVVLLVRSAGVAAAKKTGSECAHRGG